MKTKILKPIPFVAILILATLFISGCDTLEVAQVQAPRHDYFFYSELAAGYPADSYHVRDTFYGRVGSDFNLYRLESMTPPNSVTPANCDMTHDDAPPPGLELTHNASISGTPTLAGDYYYHIKFDNISYSYMDNNGVKQQVKANDEPITLHIIIRDSLAKTLVGQWKGNSVDDTFNIESDISHMV